ncbi:hypothetical protein Cpir12675_006964 [Ceratocystis pirilliformis]|uniref:CCHC-type domain-containing protein n=1 Tax=Ceratocystis pirilliformis TaxID=259994 RepID=A0ABR3YDE2_9PEZI
MATYAQNLVGPRFTQCMKLKQTPEEFLSYLDNLFLDPNAAMRAEAKLTRLVQRPDEAFATFLPKFENLKWEANIEGDRASRPSVGVSTPTRGHGPEHTVQSTRAYAGPDKTYFARDPGDMNWQPTNTVVLKPLTSIERETLRKWRACFLCRQPGHIATSCPLGRPAPVVTSNIGAGIPDEESGNERA